MDRIHRQFVLGGHKAAAIAMTELKAGIDLVSSLDDSLVEQLFMTPRRSIAEAFEAAIKDYGEDASVIAMPFGGATLPFLKS